MPTADPAPLINGRGHDVAQLLRQGPYRLDYFQREYVWGRNEVGKLVEDLTMKFLRQWRPDHGPTDVKAYQPYFLGPFVTYERGERQYLADGQQRFVTLVLLLICLRRLLLQREEDDQATTVANLIRSHRFGRTTFAVDVDAYAPCFDALYNERAFSPDGQTLAVEWIWKAYQYITDDLPEEIREDALPLFCDWLLYRVSLVEIMAWDDDRAWEVFQSMNDRGVHLSSMDHLKAYLLNDADSTDREHLDAVWQGMVNSIERVERGAAIEFVQTVLRARFIATDNDGNSTAAGPDLAAATHEWVRAHQAVIWPAYRRGDRAKFVRDLLVPLSDTYLRMLRAKLDVRKGQEAVFFNARNGIARQFDLAMACIHPAEPDSVKAQKIRLAANLIDLLVIANGIKNHSVGQADVDSVVTELLGRVRLATTPDELRTHITDYLAEQANPFDFSGMDTLRRRDSNDAVIRYLLARLTGWLEAGTERGDVGQCLRGRRQYQIEHLFPASAASYWPFVTDDELYRKLRDRIGALVLLDGVENASLNDKPLAEKADAYRGHNLLAASLAEVTYTGRGTARFRRFIREQGLKDLFRPYVDGEPIAELVAARCRLYQAMAERIWSPDSLGFTTARPTATTKPTKSQAARGTKTRTRRSYGVSIDLLVRAAYLLAGDILVGQLRSRSYQATVLIDGRIRTSTGAAFDTPSAAAMDALDRASWNGWSFWRVQRTGELLSDLRKRFLDEGRSGA